MDKVEENLKEFKAVFFRKLRNEWCDEDGKKANSFFKRGLFAAVAVLRSHGPYQYNRTGRTWPASMSSVYMRKEFNSHRIGLGHQRGRRFIVLEHQYGRRDSV